MGCSSSKIEKCEALRLCKERKRFIKEAIDSRYALTAAHLSYVQSLRSIGIALRRFAEAEVLIESSLSTSATELDKTPSHSSYPSPSPSHNAELVYSPLQNESPYSPPISTISYMKSSRSASVTVKIDPTLSRFVEDESIALPPPPPPPFSPTEIDSSWDYFDPIDDTKSFKFVRENGLRQYRGDEIVPSMEDADIDCNGENFVGSMRSGSKQRVADLCHNSAVRSRNSDRLMASNGHSFNFDTSEKFEDAEQTPFDDGKLFKPDRVAGGSGETLVGNVALELSSSARERTGTGKELCAEREDPSEYITHRAKDFLSSIKDIEHRFFRASESGKEVSRMLEASKIRLKCSEAKGRSTALIFLEAFHLACCRGENVIPNEPPQQVTKVITWHRSASSQSSSSKNPLALASKDDNDDSGSDFVEEFCMITGSHSSTLDRLYAWERKLCDEVKASEVIRKLYDHWCDQLRHQFARDASAQVIDKTRAVVKDLHSQIRVALHAVDSIAKRIERLRDEELQPQLVELIQGLIRMWKVMLECHHAQYITISLAYYTKSSTTGPTQKESYGQVVAQLQQEIECFRSSFADWIDAHKSYVEALNGWLQTCIVLPQERARGRRAFSPRRALAPPIFVLCRDWSAGIKTLPSGELIDSIKAFVSDLHNSIAQQVEEQKISERPLDSINNGDIESKEDEKSDKSSNLSSIHTSLTKVLDRLTKFSEALRKMYEDIRQGTEAAQVAYANCRTIR